MENKLKRRAADDDNGQPSKRPKPMEPQANGRDDKGVPLKLDNLNDYCLEDIFKYLELSDLLNVANAGDRFISEAKRAARRKFRKGTVEISDEDISMNGNEEAIIFWPAGVHKLLTFFDLFGADISTLMINYDGDNENHDLTYRVQLLENLIIKHCSQTIISLKLLGLSFKHEIFVHTTKRFAALQHLEIGTYLDDAYPTLFENDDIKAFIRVNPQIRTCVTKANDCLTEEFWQFINEHLPQLEQVELADFIGHGDSDGWQIMKYTKKDQKLFANHVPRFAISNLEQLELDCIDDFFDEVLEYVCKNRNLMRLKLLGFESENSEPIHDEAITMLIRKLPKLTELSVYAMDITVDSLVRVLTECKSMQIVHLVDPFDVEELYESCMKAKIGIKWKLSREMEELKIIRR